MMVPVLKCVAGEHVCIYHMLIYFPLDAVFLNIMPEDYTLITIHLGTFVPDTR